MRARVAWLPLLVLSVSMSGCIAGFDPTPAAAPRPPVASFTVTQVGELAFSFDGSASSGGIVNYTWELGDGNRAFGPRAQHTYAYTNGVYEVQLVVRNRIGLLSASAQRVQVGSGENLPPTAAFTASTWRAATGETIALDSSASADPDGDPLLYEWDPYWPITASEYRAFRAERGGTMPAAHEHADLTGEEGDGHDDHDHPTGPHATPDPPPVPIPIPVPTAPSHGGEKGSTKDAYYQKEGRSEEDHVLVQYPMEGLYYIHLRVYDVKGAYDDEVWPILVEASPPATTLSTNWTGNVTLGLADNGPALPSPLEGLDRNTTAVPLSYPAPTFVANVTYEVHPDDLPYELRRRIDQRVRVDLLFNGEVIATGEPSTELGWLRLGVGPLEDGAVEVRVVALQGFDVDFFVQVDATLDTNPFTAEGFLRTHR